MATPDYIKHLTEQGYALVRGVFDAAEMAELQAEARRIYDEALALERSWRHGNRFFEIADDPEGGHVVLQAHWFALASPVMEYYRRHHKLLPILEPILGPTIRQSTNQLHWKPPGAKYVAFNFHQDARFTGLDPHEVAWLIPYQVTTGLAIDPQTVENGALRVFPGSHKLGYLGLSDAGHGYIMSGGADQTAEMRAAGLDPNDAVDVEMEPGDLLLWNLFLVHGSGANKSASYRTFQINAYVNGDKIGSGETAFVDGRSTPLDPDNLTLKFWDRPEPHYIDGADWIAQTEGRS